MANIREFDNPIGGLQPSDGGLTAYRLLAQHQSETGRQVGGEIGGSIQSVAQSAGQLYDKHVVQTEITKGATAGSGMFANWMSDYNDTMSKADLNDSTAAQKWMDNTFEPQAQKFVDSFKTSDGQAWAEKWVQNQRDHFTTLRVADTAKRAGDAQVLNYHTTSDNNAAAASYGGLASLDMVLKNQDDANKQFAAGLGPDRQGAFLEQAEKDKAGLVHSAFSAAMEGPNHDGATAAQFLKDFDSGKLSAYDKYMDANERIAVRSAAQTWSNANATQKKEQAAADEKANFTDYTNRLNKITTAAVTFDNDGTAHVAPGYDTAVMANLSASGSVGEPGGVAARAAINAAHTWQTEAATGVKTQDDPKVYEQMRTLQYDEGFTKQTVDEAVGQHLLSSASAQYFYNVVDHRDAKMIADHKDLTGFMTAQKAGIMAGGVGVDGVPLKDANGLLQAPQGEINFHNFQIEAERRFDAGLQQNLKPRDMVDPKSPNYQFKDMNTFYTGKAPLGTATVQGPATGSPTPPPADGKDTYAVWSAAHGKDPDGYAAYRAAPAAAAPAKVNPQSQDEWMKANPGKTAEDYARGHKAGPAPGGVEKDIGAAIGGAAKAVGDFVNAPYVGPGADKTPTQVSRPYPTDKQRLDQPSAAPTGYMRDKYGVLHVTR